MSRLNGRLKRLEKAAAQLEPDKLTIIIKYVDQGELPLLPDDWCSGDGVRYSVENR